MKRQPILSFQHGATLIVGLIMLAVITILVTTAFTLSDTNLKAVGNMQFRDEATSAANIAIEGVVTAFTDVTTVPTATNNNPVDLNYDGNPEYMVNINPTCIRTYVISNGSDAGGSGDIENPNLSKSATPASYYTVWDIRATVTDTASGATVRVHQGIRKLLSSLPTACT